MRLGNRVKCNAYIKKSGNHYLIDNRRRQEGENCDANQRYPRRVAQP